MTKRLMRVSGRQGLWVAAVLAAFAGGVVTMQAQVVRAPRYSGGVDAPTPQSVLPPLPPAITPHGTVVEDVVVRVNDQIISRSDVERAEQQLQQEAAQQNVPAAELAQKQRDLLRDMIDQQLLLSKAKELGLNADADVIRRLDDIRKQNKMDSMEDLEKAARQQGVSFEDFKAQIRNQILTQQVVRDEVGRRLQLSPSDEQKYYQAHLSEFEQPEQIRLSEILVPLPETASAAEVAQAQAKADEIRAKVAAGGDFADLAKKYSGGPSAAQGGELGLWKRGALAKVLEDQTFPLKVGDATQPIRTRQGFVILKVTQHDQAGPSPLKDVEPQIQEALYMQAMQPALRAYLTKLREEAYVDVQPGFVDSGASAKETKPIFTAYAPPAPKKKKAAKEKARFDRGGRFSTAKVSAPVFASPDTTGSRTLTGAEATTPIDPATGLAVIKPTANTAQAAPTQTAPAMNGKVKKAKVARKEKIRFGQAPRTALPAGPDDAQTATTSGGTPATAVGTSTAGQGVGMTTAVAPANESADLGANPLTPVAPPKQKTRFSAKAPEVKARKAAVVSARQQEKIAATPSAETSEEKANRSVQSAPLGLNGDTGKKPKKKKRVKGEKKERLQDKPETKQVEAAAPDPTANPNLAPSASTPATNKTQQPNSVPPTNSSVPRPATVPDSTLPPATQPVPGSQIPTGQPPTSE